MRIHAPLAFEVIYEDHFRFVWSTLLRLGVPRHAVEDASQETFLVVHRRLGDFEGRGSPRAWLFGIARRVAFRVRRTQDRRRRKISALRTELPWSTPLDEAVAQRQLSALLLDALDELDDDKRVALTLHVFEEMSGPKVAELLGLNVDTAYSRIKAGRRALKEVLGARGVDADMARLVRATRLQTRPGVDAQERVAALLAAPLASLSAPVAAGLTWKGLAIAASFGVAALGGILTVRTLASPPVTERKTSGMAPEPQRTTPDSKPEPARAAAVAAAAPEPTEPRSPRSPPRRAVKSQAVVHTIPEDSGKALGLRAEVALIERATTALRGEDGAKALMILAEHAKRFPSGQLAAERRAYRAVALCSVGNLPQGRAEARLARAAQPSKALAAWLDAACGPSTPRDL